MSSLPLGKAGVGSAVNDTTRELGGALGVAILGSLLTSAYRDGLGDALAGAPAPAVDAARSSLGGALAVAGQLGDGAIADAARAAFVDGLGIAVLVGAGMTLLGAAFVAWHLRPSRTGEGSSDDLVVGLGGSAGRHPVPTDEAQPVLEPSYARSPQLDGA